MIEGALRWERRDEVPINLSPRRRTLPRRRQKRIAFYTKDRKKELKEISLLKRRDKNDTDRLPHQGIGLVPMAIF